jgi:hypothetical protein
MAAAEAARAAATAKVFIVVVWELMIIAGLVCCSSKQEKLPATDRRSSNSRETSEWSCNRVKVVRSTHKSGGEGKKGHSRI